jgi:hypothetical protein
MSGLASALSNGPGILNPIAGTTTQSGARQPVAFTGTVKPCDVLTVLRTPTIFTSKRGAVSPDISINFAKKMKPEGIARGTIGGKSALVIVDDNGGFQVVWAGR